MPDARQILNSPSLAAARRRATYLLLTLCGLFLSCALFALLCVSWASVSLLILSKLGLWLMRLWANTLRRAFPSLRLPSWWCSLTRSTALQMLLNRASWLRRVLSPSRLRFRRLRCRLRLRIRALLSKAMMCAVLLVVAVLSSSVLAFLQDRLLLRSIEAMMQARSTV